MSINATTSQRQESVYVYEAPVRLWHWINAFAIATLCVTGYLIGSPPPAVGGEAYDNFQFGWIRYIHFSAGYVLLVGFLFRMYWAFAGNSHARQIFMPEVWKPRFWEEVAHEIKWYLFIAKSPMKYTGHNPLAVLVMHVVLVWGTIFMIVTGLALYGEGTGMGSWQHTFFSSWVIPLFGQSQDVHTWHHMVMWAIICFVIVHIYAAVREDIMSRQTIISSMFSGWRTFRDDGAPKDDH
jgi:Ni/Fe-hydrogenase 1 B-type cytochrome subunit